jgi:excisionase family DNA binding protein
MISMIATLTKNAGPIKPDKDPLSAIAERLTSRLPKLGTKAKPEVLMALHELLDGPDETARLIRTQMQIYLAKVSDALLSEQTRAAASDQPLTTEDAAKLMQCSRPYVAMLIDSGKLTGSYLTAGGHRRVPKSVVLAWITEHNGAALEVDANYKTAALHAGMYGVPEAQYVAQARRNKKKHGA